MIFFREVILYLISQAAILDVHYMEAMNTLNELKTVVNQNCEVRLVLQEARTLVAKLDKEFKKIKDANDKVITTRVNRRGYEEINKFFSDLNRDRPEEQNKGKE
jgi:hypothetical protein